MGLSGSSSETVNLVKQKKKKSPTPSQPIKQCECIDAGQQTSASKNKSGAGQNRDDTFSFTSCSLKKLLASESPKLMMALIVAVGALTVILVIKCICCPAIITDLTQETRERRSNDAVGNDFDRKPWENSKTRLMSEFSDLTGKDTRDTNLHSGDGDYPEYLTPDLSSILDPIKVNEGYGSNNLRDFYRKLLKTDIQIKNLKKGFANIKRGNIDLTDPNMPRLKRSPIIFSATPERYVKTPSSNRDSEENLHKYHPLSDTLKTDKDVEKNTKADFDHMIDSSSDIEKVKAFIKENKLQHEAKELENNELFNSFQYEVSKATRNNMKNEKYTQWLDAVFGRVTQSTQHRRLLQHEDREEDDDTTEDYEEQTKEPWDREKRGVSPLEIYIKTDNNLAATTKSPKSKTSDLKESTTHYNEEINFLIDAALKMKTGKIDDLEHKEKNPNVIANNEYLEDNSNYNELVAMAQAYSDYGVLDNKKEIIENNVAPGNNLKLITSEKPHETVEWLNVNVDKPHGEEFKLKYNGESKMEKPTFFKMLRLKMFANDFHSEIKNNNIEVTKTPSNTPIKITNSSHMSETATSRSKISQKPIKKHKERNVMYSGHRRSLKSVEGEKINDDAPATASDVGHTINTDQLQDNEEANLTYFNDSMNLERSYEYNKSVSNETDNKIVLSVGKEEKVSNLSENTLKLNNRSTSLGLGELFGMLADFSIFLSGFDTNQEDNGYRFLSDFVTMLNPNYLPTKNKTSSDKLTNDTRALTIASSDTEIKENIGHRSRLLLSFDDKEENVTSTTDHEKEDINESYVITSKNHANASIDSKKITNSSETKNKNAIIEVGNRTVVKRSANGDNIFWNDMYDDEYGIKDPMEDDMKDKSSVKFNDLMGKDNWIGTKFKMIAKSLKERRNRKMDRKNKNFRNKTKTHTKRSVPITDDTSKRMFEGLTATMKKVCHQAAEAIHETTNREVRADSDQASTLMQQLVGLMSELVDLQVREKTCVQLPEDLRSFLVWLTSPSTEERNDMGFSVDSYDADPMSNLHNADDMLSSNARSECLGTIHDVEDLILQYDEMSEEDKSKMSGVREYLEHQLHYLHKQLSNFNEFGSSAMYREQPIRRRRQQKPSINKQNKRKAYKYLNYYGKKHTKHTVSDESLTEDYRNMEGKGVRNDNIKDSKNEDNELFENNGEMSLNENRRLSRNAEMDMKRRLHDYFSSLVKDNESIVKYDKM